MKLRIEMLYPHLVVTPISLFVLLACSTTTRGGTTDQYITAQPSLPPLSINLDTDDPEYAGWERESVKYSASLDYNGNGRSDHENVAQAENNGSAIIIDLSDNLRGGTLTAAGTLFLYKQDDDGDHFGAKDVSATVIIRGRNPSKAGIRNRINNAQLDVLAYMASRFQQFDSQGEPLSREPGHFGVMQLSGSSAGVHQLWDWTANVDAGRQQFTELQNTASAYLGDVKKTHPEASGWTPEQLSLEIYSLSRGEHYWIWDITSKAWQINQTSTHPDPRRFATTAKNVQDNVTSGMPPSDWDGPTGLDVAFEKTTYAPHEPIRATITASGSVLIENDITQQSQQINVNGTQTVDLGTPTSPGFYGFTFSDGVSVLPTIVPVFGTIRIEPAGPMISGQESGILNRLMSLMTKDRLKRTWDGWSGKEFFISKIVTFGAAASFGIACLYGGVPACIVAETSAQDLAVEFTAQLLIQFATVCAKDGAISSSEEKLAEAVIRGGKVVLGVVTEAELRDKIVNAIQGSLSEIFDATATEGNTKLTVGLFNDQAKKTYVIITKVKL